MSNEMIVTEEKPQTAVMTTSPSKLLEIAVNKDADIDKLEKLMNLQNLWEMKQAKKEFYQALSDFQSQAPSVKKLKNGHNYKYAPLGDIVEQVKPFLHKAGLSYRFEQDHSNGIQVTCCINHIGGHSEKTTMTAAADTSGSKNGIQGIGSTVFIPAALHPNKRIRHCGLQMKILMGAYLKSQLKQLLMHKQTNWKGLLKKQAQPLKSFALILQ